jgi:hypothetical protein
MSFIGISLCTIFSANAQSALLNATTSGTSLSDLPHANANAITLSTATDSTPKVSKEPKWYEQIQLRGYTQFRYNNLLMSNENLTCDQCDRSIGGTGGFFIRRMRFIFFGQLSNNVYFYIQPDFGSSISSTSLNFGQLRDAYMDVGFDKKNEFRVRIGLSKVPYGFENMQSSQNRLPLDRADALNSSHPNERDLGAFFYWAPEKTRKLYASLVRDGLKGSGDYGVFGIGVYNGQAANKPELNKKPHAVARLSYPISLKKGQIIEPGLQAYAGQYVMAKDQLSSGAKYLSDRTYVDRRAAATFVLYPKPFGIQAEYNVGKGPRFNTATDSIESSFLHGGYITMSYRYAFKKRLIIPYVRAQYFDGGKKLELDARSYQVRELEAGIEWPVNKHFEFTMAYMVSNRRYEDFVKQDNLQKGHNLRMQAQLNF